MMKIYYNFIGNMIRVDNIQKMFIDGQKIVLQYIEDSKIITDSVSYENVKPDVNEEKQKIEKDFEAVQKLLRTKNEPLYTKSEVDEKIQKEVEKLKSENIFITTKCSGFEEGMRTRNNKLIKIMRILEDKKLKKIKRIKEVIYNDKI